MQGWIQPGWALLKAQNRSLDRVAVATGLAVLVHAVGLVGILFIDRQAFISMTPVNLVIMQVLAWWTSRANAGTYFKAFAFLFLLGFLAEWAGVHTGLLFGTYTYGSWMGPQLDGVPWLIGGNWFLVLIGSLTLALQLRYLFAERISIRFKLKSPLFVSLGTALLAALVATAFDRVMEPAAIKLGFWTWSQGDPPVYNYICWFILGFLAIWWGGDRLRPVATTFTYRLLLIQAVFFALIGVSR